MANKNMNKEEKTKTNRIPYLDYLRVFSCLAVVAIHTITGWTSAFDINSNRMRIDMDIVESLFRIAVPLFLMISGALLLRKDKELPWTKIKKYITRMLLVLATFGLAYCLSESLINGQRGGQLVLESIANVLSGKSWGVMWYIYMIIGIYILTPVLKKFTDSCDKKEFTTVMTILFVVSSLIPTINGFTGLKITNFYLGPSIYAFYYLLGQYLSRYAISSRYLWLPLIVGVAGSIVKSELGIQLEGDLSSIFIVMTSFSVFAYMKNSKLKNNKWVSFIAKYSFGVYLIHCLWINIAYKGLHIYPDTMPPAIGELAIYVYVLFASLIGGIILCRLPLFKKILK